MKRALLVICVVLFSITAQAQKKKKNAKISMEVDGVCLMCKKRIEKAALNTKGVKFALWNVKTHELKLIIDERKTDVKTIQQKIADVGHDTKLIKATDEAYNSVHPCCKYRDINIVKDHQKPKGKQ